jgi:TrmH family RNA methyltransferase
MILPDCKKQSRNPDLSPSVPETIAVLSKASLRFKQLRAELGATGANRMHTLLLGEKLALEWLSSKKQAKNRLAPTRWLRLEGQRPHSCERELRLETWELGEKLMREISDSASPPAFALMMKLTAEPAGPVAMRAVVPWGVQDPGNLGAIIRSAAAFGFQEALLGPGCADPFSPKALRGSMGAAFLMPIRRFSKECFADGRWIALDSGKGAIALESIDLSEPLRLMVGNEGHGWQIDDLPKHCIRASIATQSVESLNASVAAGIACYEAARRHGW